MLIVAALPPPQLRALIEFARALEVEVLCEARDEDELDRAMAAGARLVGVNARDLHTFQLDPDRCARLRRSVPASFTYVAESGIHGPDEVLRLRDAGADAVLIGSYLMQAEHPGEALRAIVAEL